MQIQVHFLPTLAERDDFSDDVVVVIDVLRATTTMVHALAAGAKQIHTCRTVEQARELKKQLSGKALLGGERGGSKIPGFDLGNSPLEYTPAVVSGRSIVFTTTNGTVALEHAATAKQVVIGAFVNLTAVCNLVQDVPRLHLLCAGTNGEITREDVLFAGAVCEEMSNSSAVDSLNDQGVLARNAWQNAIVNLGSCSLFDSLRESSGARNLIEIGHERDIEIAATVDQFDFVPVFQEGIVGRAKP